MGNKMQIPKANRPSERESIAKPVFVSSEDKVTFSFSALEKTKHFNLDVTCPNWPSELFDMLKNVSSVSKNDLILGKYKTYRVHTHENAVPPDPVPNGVVLKDCYQIRLSKSKGGIHGVFNENVFYVIWLDPLHNMYPDEKYGGLRIISPPLTCCADREETIRELNEKVAKLEQELEFWEGEAQKAYNQNSEESSIVN